MSPFGTEVSLLLVVMVVGLLALLDLVVWREKK